MLALLSLMGTVVTTSAQHQPDYDYGNGGDYNGGGGGDYGHETGDSYQDYVDPYTHPDSLYEDLAQKMEGGVNGGGGGG